MNNSLKRLTLLILVSRFFALVGAGCQPPKGCGRDVEKVGEKIQGE